MLILFSIHPLQNGPDHLLHDDVSADVFATPAGDAGLDPGLAGPADPVAVLTAVSLTRHPLQADRALGEQGWLHRFQPFSAISYFAL